MSFYTTNGEPLQWVETVKHLGNILKSNNSMKRDCLAKRAQLIGKIHSLLQEFHYAEPAVILRILNIHVTSFYGSSIWDLYSKEVVRVFSTWNVTVRNIFKLPWTTHRYFIEPVSNCSHPKTLLCTRLVKFLWSMQTSSKLCIRFLSGLVRNDMRTVMGRTVSRIAVDCKIGNKELITPADARKLCYFPPPSGEEWRIPLLLELLFANLGEILTMFRLDPIPE